MASKIFQVIDRYCKFENILPEELLEIDFNELNSIQMEVKDIMKEDLQNIKKLWNFVYESSNYKYWLKFVNKDNFHRTFNPIYRPMWIDSSLNIRIEIIFTEHLLLFMEIIKECI